MRRLFITGLILIISACGGSRESQFSSNSKEVTPEVQTGIAKYQGKADCTAFLLDLKNDAAPAYMLTSGHCAQNFSALDTPYTVIQNESVTHKVTFFYTESNQASQKIFIVPTVVYSTMNQTDIAILKLNSTVGELRSQGIEPITIQSSASATNASISVIGTPIGQFIKQVFCTQGRLTDVTEFSWVWSQLQSNNCLKIYPGMSGSPVYDMNSRQVVGIVNTTTIDMIESVNCYLSSPCEITSQGTRPIANTSYAVPIEKLHACFVNGHWSPQANICPLALASGPAILPSYLYSPMQHKQATQRWRFEGDTNEDVMIKIITAGLDTCQNTNDYKPFNTHELPYLPTQENMYLACLRNKNGLTIHPIQIDNTAPKTPAKVKVLFERGSSRLVELGFAPPEISGYLHTTANSEQACLEAQDFSQYHRVPLLLNAPTYLCLKISDRAGNLTGINTYFID
jgi:hypothetical protein